MKPTKQQIDELLSMIREAAMTCDHLEWEATRPAVEELHSALRGPMKMFRPATETTVRISMTHRPKTPKTKPRRTNRA